MKGIVVKEIMPLLVLPLIMAPVSYNLKICKINGQSWGQSLFKAEVGITLVRTEVCHKFSLNVG
jgi:hypothetical protein